MRKTMKKTIFAALAGILLVGVAIVLPLSSAYAVEVFSAETELRQYNSAKSYGGYFMPSPWGAAFGSAPTVYLMDMQGYIVHQWKSVPGWAPQIQEDGTLWSGGYIQDWDGNTLWSYTTAPYMAHHAWRKLWNKKLNQWTMLVLCNRAMSQAEAVDMGMDPGVTYGDRLGEIDFIAEISMDKQIVWEWHPWDHGCQSKNPAFKNYVTDTKLAPGRYDVNWLTDGQQPADSGTAGVFADWLHTNSIDYDEDTGHIAMNHLNWSQFVVIDHDKTFVSTTNWAANKAAAAGPDGDIIYRFGAPASYNAGKSPGFMTEGDNQVFAAHDIQWIRHYHWKKPRLSTDKWPDPSTYTKSGIALPGAGNFLIFDNGMLNPTGMRSRIIQINPRIGASGAVEVPAGQYIWPDIAGYEPYAVSPWDGRASTSYHKNKQVTWLYGSLFKNSFYSSYISGCQRLPNGNTSINAGEQQHMFEVTSSGEVVWEYIYPGAVGSAAKILVDGAGDNHIYRHYRYGKDYPGLSGRVLTPIQTITGRLPRVVGSTDSYPPDVIYTGFGYGAGGTVGGGGGGVGAGSGGGGGY